VTPLLAVHPLATTNAVLNGIATLLLDRRLDRDRPRPWKAHRAFMVVAFLVSAVFLVCYLTYHWLVGHVPFRGQGPIRAVYFSILVSHILLAVAVPVLAVTMFVLAWRGALGGPSPAGQSDPADLALCLGHRRGDLPDAV